jgi:hypothetical protein
MSESFEGKKYADKYIEGAVRNNGEFVDALNEAGDLEQLKQVVREFTFVDEEGEGIVFEIIEGDGDEIDAVTFSEEEVLKAIELMKDGVPEVDEIRSWIPHTKIAEAVIRITGAT